MRELEKIVRVAGRLDPEAPHEKMLVLDSSQGQYQCQITVGSSSREIRQSALAFRADVVIYGRHGSFHYENFTDGEVPVKEMISPFLCTVIVPD